MKTVWKFTLDMRGQNPTPIPNGAKLVLVGLCPATGAVAMWWELNPDAPTDLRYFRIYGTGHDIMEDEVHIGSAIDRSFVWHVYEVKV